MREEEKCREFLEHWEAIAFDDPAAGRCHADQGIEWVAKLGNPQDLQARALTILGSSYRAVSDLARAERAFEQALTIYRSLTAPERAMAFDQADCYRRLAYLRLEQRRFDEALDLVSRAVAVFVVSHRHHELGRAYLAKGVIQLKMNDPAAITTLCQAHSKLDPAKNPNDFHAVSHNLLLALCQLEPDSDILEHALEILKEARLTHRTLRPGRHIGHRHHLCGRPRLTMPDAKTRFLQGRISMLLGNYEAARRLFETARSDLMALEMPLAVAEVSIELAECYLLSRARCWHKIARLAQDALQLLAPVPNAAETLVACQLLQKAALARSHSRVKREIAKYRDRLKQKGKVTE